MPHPARPARIARVPTSGHSLAGDAQMSTSAREQRVDAGSSPFGCGPCKARTPRDYEACRECSPRDPSRDPSIAATLRGVSADHHQGRWPVTESAAAPWPTATSQNTSLSAYSQHYSISQRVENCDGLPVAQPPPKKKTIASRRSAALQSGG